RWLLSCAIVVNANAFVQVLLKPIKKWMSNKQIDILRVVFGPVGYRILHATIPNVASLTAPPVIITESK
ncbi:hypothetical protein WUBG_15961, partial [Wuchereria bancrofti]